MTVFSPGTGIPLHSHNVEESVLVYEGEATAVVGDDEFDLVAGQATWVPAGVPHCFRNRGEGSMTIYWVYGGRDVTRTITATGETFEHLSESDRGATPARRGVAMNTVITVNPATGKPLAEYPAFSDADVDAALDRAAAAQTGWAALPYPERAAVLRRAAEGLRAGIDELALLVTREMGKPLAESRAEVEKCATACDYYAEHAGEFLADEPVATSADDSWIGYEPVGVVLAVMPWNFPLWQVLRFAAPALMAGNAALLKHSPNTTGCALAVAGDLRRGGRARGAVRRPRGRRARRPGGHPAADRGPAGRGGHDHRQRAGRPGGRRRPRATPSRSRCWSSGGSDPFVVLADADLPRVAAHGGAGTAPQRRAELHLAQAHRGRRVGRRGVHPSPRRRGRGAHRRRPGGARHRRRPDGPRGPARGGAPAGRGVRRGRSPAAHRWTAARRPGHFYAPTVLADVAPGQPAYDAEIFGPVAAVIVVDGEDEAVRVANDTRFGLGASVWTSDPARGIAVGRRIRSGAVFVNALVASDVRMPFGGTRASGYGRELAAAGIREFVNVRTWWVLDRPVGTAPTSE